MVRLLFAALVVVGTYGSAIAAPWTTPDPVPELVDPLIVTGKCISDPDWPGGEPMAGRDVRIIFPTDRDCLFPVEANNIVGPGNKAIIGGTHKNPARNIWITGGKFSPTNYPQTAVSNGWPTGPTIRWVKGTTYWEGFHIDMKCTCRDALALTSLGYYENGQTLDGNQPDAKTPKVVLVNGILENPLLCDPGTHGDIIHSQGDGNDGSTRPNIKLQNVVFSSSSQGLFLDNGSGQSQIGHGVNKLEFDTVVARRSSLGCSRIPNPGSWESVLWRVAPAQGVYFKNTWFDYTTNPTTVPAPNGFTSAGCATYDASAGVKTTGWCRGAPPAGYPVTPSTVGRNYKRENFTGETEPEPDPDPDPEPVTARDRIFSKQGFADLNRALAAEFIGQGRPNDVVAYTYREHEKGAAAGSADLCRADGITWGGDVAEDSLYITSALSSPADLDVTIGTAAATRVSLPANQAQAGQQVVMPLNGRVGRPLFVLSRNGVKVSEWSGKLEILASPPARNVSTYSGAQVLPRGEQPQQPKAWFSAVALDQPEGNSGSKSFVVRAHRETATDTMTARCVVEAGTATASDFVGGTLPVVDFSLSPGVLTADSTSILVAGDVDVEADETAKIVCSDVKPTNYSAPARQEISLIIRNDDSASAPSRFSVRAISASVFEGTGATVPIALEVTREGTSTEAASVDICQVPSDLSGAQSSANDFVDGFLRQTLPFGAGEMGTKYIERQVVGDDVPEPDEWATYRLLFASSGSTITTGTANVQIRDDDSPYAGALFIDAGAEAPYTDGAGNVWAPDTGTGGSIASNTFDYAGTTDDQIYRTHRYGASSYKLQLTPAVYDIFGLFAEHDAANDNIDCNGTDPEDPTDDNVGRRLMVASVAATGGDSVTSETIDPYCSAGFRTAHRVRLARVNAPQGTITLSMRSAANSQAVPVINGIEAAKVVETEPARAQEWLNVGAPEGSSYTDPAANVWRGIPPGMVSGCTSVVDGNAPPIDGTEADQLYWSRCQGMDMTFTVPIDTANDTSPTRSVNLLFSEPTAPEGARVVDIYVQGVLQVADLDVRVAAGALRRALIKSVSPVTIGPDGLLRVRVVAKTSAPAMISGLSVVEPLVATEKAETIGWKGRKKIAKTDLIKVLSPTLRSPSGNPLVIREVDTTSSTVFVCHAACAPTATHGVQPDTDAANKSALLEIVAHDLSDPTVSLFPALGRFKSTEDTFKVTVAELLPGGALGVETIVTVRLRVNRLL